MAVPIVVLTGGGLPVTESTSGFGLPVEVATNGFGLGVTIVSSGGLPVIGSGGGGTPTGDGSMDFSIATGDNTGLLALLEDI